MFALTTARASQQAGPGALPVRASAVSANAALASDEPQLQAMATILDLVTWLAPMHLALFYTVNEDGEKYARDPIVAKTSGEIGFTLDEALDTYVEHYGPRDPFAPCRLPDENMTIATLRDVPGARWYAQTLAERFEILPTASLYFREEGQIVAGLSLGRRLRAPRLSASELIMLERCHPWFEFFYSLALRQKMVSVPYTFDRRFTSREREVLSAMTAPKSYEEIALQLEISSTTLKTHVKHVLRKLGARNRAEAVAMVMQAHEPPGARRPPIGGVVGSD